MEPPRTPLAPHSPASSWPAWRFTALRGVLLAWLCVLAIEFGHVGTGGPMGAGPRWLRDLELSLADTQWWFWGLPLLAAAIAWPGSGRSQKALSDREDSAELLALFHPLTIVTLLTGAAAGLLHWALLTSVFTGMGGATPAYHDEASYLLQSQMIVDAATGQTPPSESAGPWARPTTQPEELFDQMHVWNRGVRASRYFPGTGLWLAVWNGTNDEAAVFAIHAAGCFAVVCWTLLAGRLGGAGAAGIAGLFLATAPGLLLFHNLILAHAPTLLGLGILFVAWTYQPSYGELISVRYRDGWGWSLAAGTGLAGAMLCRPLTAAGVALPLGLLWLTRCFHSRCPRQGCAAERRLAVTGTLGLGLPLLVGFAIMAHQNHAITGSYFTTAYSAYTERFTPRHVYGFNNRVRGERNLGPEVLTHYDEWAENLTVPLALENFGRRLVSSWRYTVGLVPALVVCTLVLGLYPQLTTVTRALLGGIFALHAVYFPYWYDGIMHWHYVYESAPLWIVLAAVTTAEVGRLAWRDRRRLAVAAGAFALALAAIGQLSPLGSPDQTLLAKGTSELRFAKTKYQAFDAILEQQVLDRPALVMVIPNPDDRHIDFVRNPAALDGDLLRIRYLPDRVPLDQIRKSFPERSLYTIDAKTGAVRRITERE
jgi:hypothetical protein